MKFDRISFISSYWCALQRLRLAGGENVCLCVREREEATERDTKEALKMTRLRRNRVCGGSAASPRWVGVWWGVVNELPEVIES